MCFKIYSYSCCVVLDHSSNGLRITGLWFVIKLEYHGGLYPFMGNQGGQNPIVIQDQNRIYYMDFYLSVVLGLVSG